MSENEHLREVRCYFTDQEWAEMPELRKDLYGNIKRNYDVMVSLGLKPTLPEFMKPKPVAQKRVAKKRAQSSSEKQQLKTPANSTQAPETSAKGKINSGGGKLAPLKKTWTAPVKDHAVVADNTQLAADAATVHKSAIASDAVCKRPSRAQKKINYAECDDSDKESTDKKFWAEDVAAPRVVISCEDCGEPFPEKQLLDHHRQREHPQRRQGKYQCTHCPYSNNHSSNMTKHERIHTGERPFVCNVCDRGFTERRNLNRHLLVHTREKPHECPGCGQRFTRASDMARHRRRQHSAESTGRKHNVCPECGKEFAKRGHLTNHLLTHTGEKPHACSECGMRFALPGHARKHELAVHGHQYPLHCAHCGKGCLSMNALRKHVRARHGDDDEENDDD